VADNVKYVLTLPRFEGQTFLEVTKAVRQMQQVWKERLGIEVEVRYDRHSSSDIQLMAERLAQRGGK
jgi:hypothetical protein